MSSEEYEDDNIASGEDSGTSDVEKDEDSAETGSAEERESQSPHTQEESEEDDYDALDETPPPKPFPMTISLFLPGQKGKKAACEPTCVHVCLTRGMIGRRLPGRAAQVGSNESDKQDNEEEEEEDEDEDEEEDDDEGATSAAQRSAASRNSSAFKDEEEEEEELEGTAGNLMGCCADNHYYEIDYAAPLAALRRRLILRHLHGDAKSQRRFLLSEREHRKRQHHGSNRDAEDDDDEMERNSDAETDSQGRDTNPLEEVVWPWTTVQQPPPYWLPALLSNDVFTFQRVLSIMYGWIIAPDPHPSDQLRLDSAGQLCTRSHNPKKEEQEEEVETSEEADSGPPNPDYQPSSHLFSGEEDEHTDDASNEASSDSAKPHISTPVQVTSKNLLDDLNDCEVEEDGHDQQHDSASLDGSANAHARLSISTAPPPVSALPYFPFTEYELYIVYDKASQEWHLLDTHPLFVMQACRRRRAEDLDHKDDPQGGEGEDVSPPGSDEESEGVEGSETSDKRQKGAGEKYQVPKYVLDTIIPVSPVVLAALFSPAALRCCLLQPLQAETKNQDDADHAENFDTNSETDAPAATRTVSALVVLKSFDNAWLSVDMVVALPILATICRTRQRVMQQDALRIPYALGNLWIDVNPLFTLPGLSNAAEPKEVMRWRAPPGQQTEDDSEHGDENELKEVAASMKTVALSFPHRWGTALDSIADSGNYGRLILNALLDAGILPTRSVELGIFHHLPLLRLALWWWIRLPPKVIQGWGVDVAADRLDEDDGEDAQESSSEEELEDGTTEEELDDMAVEEVTEFLLQRIEQMKERAERLRRLCLRKEHATLVFAPLLQRVLLELQRRLDRLSAIDVRGAPMPPSQYTMQESVARTYNTKLLESGRSRHDPLVTAAFVGLADAAPSTVTPATRHLRLYQSDLVLLLLALTTTPAPLPSRAKTFLDDAEQRFGPIAVKAASDVEAAHNQETQSNDVDGHTTLFSHLIDLKSMRFVRSPQDRARIGTTKLLLLCAIDFCRGATRHRVVSHLPRFELFGSTGYCPLTDLVQAWSSVCSSSTSSNHSKKVATVRLFAYYMWNEIRWRLHKRQYSEAAVVKMREQLPELFDMVDLHCNTFNNILAHLEAETDAESEATEGRDLTLRAQEAEGQTLSPGRPPLRTSGKQYGGALSSSVAAAAQRHHPPAIRAEVLQAAQKEMSEVVRPSSTTSSPLGQHLLKLSPSTPNHLPLTLAYPNAYSAEVLEAMARIATLWRSFIVAPHTYMNAETLHALLFGRTAHGEAAEGAPASSADHTRRFHIAALRVMFENGITSVQPCPLDGPETPAIEEAMRRADLQAVEILLGLGAASLQDTSLKGNATVESWAEQLFSPAQMAVLRFVAYKNKSVMRSDPRVQFGTRRAGRAIPHL